MRTPLTARLDEHRRERDLVSISRDEIDGHPLNGYVLAVSDELVALQLEVDFRLDGLRVLRLADITGVECTDTCRFQNALMAREGLDQAVPFDKALDLRDWRSLIGQLAAEYPLMILECEAGDDPDFLIGRVLSVTETSVVFEGFSGVATWYAVPDEVPLIDVTSCQVDSNYINVYHRHFERLARS